jgi:hypothetical protein
MLPPMVTLAMDLGPEFDGFSGLSALVLGMAVVAAALWLIVFAIRWLASFPRLPDAGPSTNELGPEPPAVANFLVNRWKTTHSAVEATLLDLAARKFLAVEDYVGNVVVRVHADRGEGAVSAFDQQVLDLVRSQASGGSAPIEALTLGEEDAAHRWWERFEKGVIDEARRRGLARTRWSRFDSLVLGGGLLAVFELFGLALVLAHVSVGSKNPIEGSDWLLAAGFAWLIASVGASRIRNLRDTAAGRIACARWLGVAGYYRESGVFKELGPAAVTVWDRHMAYGVALGAAHEALQGIRLFPDHPGEAWLRYHGEWREIRVEYPERFDYGSRPIRVAFEGLALSLLWGGLAFLMLPIVLVVAADVAPDLVRELLPSGEGPILILALAATVVLTVAGINLLVRFLDGAIKLVLGLLDLGHWQQIEGVVVKVHEGRVGVFDGTSHVVKALIPPATAPHLDRLMRVRVTLSPHLNYVRSIEVLGASATEAGGT